MAGWTTEKRERFEIAFYQFLNSCFINSKNLGFVSLGENLYEGQRRFIDFVLDGFENDIHRFFVLKSRQLGLTTISRALSVFYIGLHRGLKGALVFDTSDNKSNARRELETMIADLPAKLKFPKVKAKNREGLILVNSSEIQFKSAGIKKSKSTGTLGRSVGLSMAHLSELCSYNDDLEGLHSFERSLSDSNPDRLYIYESTARGHNHWEEMWYEAKEDPSCATLFIGWWSHPGQQISRDSADWDRYGLNPPTESESKKITEVRERYSFEVTMEQLAWYRRLIDPASKKEDTANLEFDPSKAYKIQEDPWTEDEAFQQSGAIFFSNEKLNDVIETQVNYKFQPYFFSVGAEFTNTHVIKAPNAKMAELKVWEEPDPDGWYAVGIDPAFGENELNDRSSIQIGRCYADGIDQVAEFASPLVRTQQFAWVIASLLGWYGAGSNSRVYYALELNGPGMPVFDELRSLKRQIEMNSYLDKQVTEQGLKDVFRNVKNYLYTRPDAIQGGLAFHLKTTPMLKVRFMERLRDFTSNAMYRIRSMDLVKEMATVAREGDTIKAPGSMKDDRVLAAAFMVHCWEAGPRKLLMGLNRTREAERARTRLTISDQVNLYQNNQLQHFFDQKRRARMDVRRQMMRKDWRYGRR